MLKHHAAQILTPNEEGNYILNEEVLEMVLTQPEVAENPVALYSVSGPFRKGKSFILNLFLEYLWNNRNIEWKKDPEKLLDKGFSWRGGKDRDTQGILIWTEPFMVDIDGKQVAILLMDTQGTFDMNTTMQGNSLVFALSTLISSMQIYNLSKRVSQNDLQSLQLFTEFGKMAQAENNDITAFQSLFFLIRDWSDGDVSYGLESGMSYIEEVLSSNKEEEIQDILRSIETSFEMKECFLMPEPSKSIRNRGKSKGPCNLKEIGKDFLEQVHYLMDHIFSDCNVPIKKVNGKEVTGVDLLNYSISYMNQLSRSEMPQVGTLFQASTETYWMNGVRLCLKTYNENMEKICNEWKHICDAELNEKNKNIKQAALKLFDRRRKMGEKKICKRYRKKLERNLDNDFTLFRNINEQNKQSHILDCNEVIEESKSELLDLLEEKLSKVDFLEEETLNDIFEEFKEKSMKDCMNKFKSGTTDQELMQKLKNNLSNSWNKIYHNKRSSNSRSKKRYQSRLRRQASSAKRVYQDIMNKKTKGGYVEQEELNNFNEEAQESAFLAFDSILFAAHSKQQMAVDIRKQLQKDLSTEMISLCHNNEIYKSNIPFQAISAAKSKYIEEMNQGCSNAMSIMYIEECHERSLKTARPILKSALSSCDQKTVLNCQKILEKEAKEIFQSFKRRSFSFEELDPEIYEKHKEALKQYKKHMNAKISKFPNTTSFETLHHDSLNMAIEYFRKEILKINGSTEGYLEELELSITAEYSIIMQEQEQLQKRKETIKQAAIQEAVTTYIKQMKQLTKGKWTLPQLLARAHGELKEGINKNWLLNAGYKAPDLLNTTLEESYQEIEKENLENKDLWVRTLTRMDTEIKAALGMFTTIKKYWNVKPLKK